MMVPASAGPLAPCDDHAVRIFIAGAAGAIGRQLVPILVEAGHEVHGTTRSPERAAWLRAMGASPVLVDAYDAAGIGDAIADADPDAVVHELTDLRAGFRDEDVASTSRLRQVSIEHVVDGMAGAGVTRLIAQSGAWLYADGPLPHREDHALLDPAANANVGSLAGILAVERRTLATPGIAGTILRYGYFYGPGTKTARRENGPAVHVGAAARATALAVTSKARGIFNVVDDGEDVSNDRARSELGWDPNSRRAVVAD